MRQCKVIGWRSLVSDKSGDRSMRVSQRIRGLAYLSYVRLWRIE